MVVVPFSIQVNNTKTMCRCIMSTAKKHSSLLKAEVKSISDKYLPFFFVQKVIAYMTKMWLLTWKSMNWVSNNKSLTVSLSNSFYALL